MAVKPGPGPSVFDVNQAPAFDLTNPEPMPESMSSTRACPGRARHPARASQSAGASIPPLCRPGGPESRTCAPSPPCLAPNLIRPSTASRCQATEKVVGVPIRYPFRIRLVQSGQLRRGATRISWWTFAWATGLGILPLTTLMVLMGDRIDMLPWYAWLQLLVGGFVLWLVSHWIFARRAVGGEQP